MKKITLLDVIIFFFMFLFVYAAVSKLLAYDLFKAQIGKSPLITGYADLYSWLVPGVELIVAALLFIPKFQLVGLYSSFTLMLGFTGYIAFMLEFSPYVPCSCGGILGSLGWREHLVFNAVCTALAAIGIPLHEKGVRNSSKTLLLK